MSDSSADAFLMIGSSWTLANQETYIQITLNESGQASDGRGMLLKIEKPPTEISTGSLAIEIWQNEVVTYQTTWGLRGPPLGVLKSQLGLWRSFKRGIVEEEWGRPAPLPRPSPQSLGGGSGRQSNSRLAISLQRLLAGDDISSEDQETIRLYAKLLLSCLKVRPQTG